MGCGSGRDLLWIKNQGFQIIGFEQSLGLANFVRMHTGCEVIEGDFEKYNFSSFKFDAILASGSLVHIPHSRLAQIIQNMKSALVRNGIFYISLKKGDHFQTDQTKRTFYLWQDAQLRELFSKLNLEIIHISNTESVIYLIDQWLGYVLKVT